MTIPTTTILPLDNEKIKEGGAQLEEYMKELIFTLQRQYEDLAQAVNGHIKRSVDVIGGEWSPVLTGSTVEGTFTYDFQTGLSLRRGLIVDIWADVKWTSSGTASGDLLVSLPYKPAVTENSPFVGIVQSSDITFTSGTCIEISAIPNTFLGQIINSGNGSSSINQGVVSSGRLSFNIRYIGQQGA